MRRALGGLWLVVFLAFGRLLTAAPAGTSPIPNRPSPLIPPPSASEPLVSFPNAVMVVGFLLFAVALALWLKGRGGRSRRAGGVGKHLSCVETLVVGAHKVHVVALGDRVYVLGASTQGLTCLDVIRDGPLHAGLMETAGPGGKSGEAPREFRDEYAGMVEEMSRAHKDPKGGWQGKLAGELEDIRRRLKGLS